MYEQKCLWITNANKTSGNCKRHHLHCHQHHHHIIPHRQINISAGTDAVSQCGWAS